MGRSERADLQVDEPFVVFQEKLTFDIVGKDEKSAVEWHFPDAMAPEDKRLTSLPVAILDIAAQGEERRKLDLGRQAEQTRHPAAISAGADRDMQIGPAPPGVECIGLLALDGPDLHTAGVRVDAVDRHRVILLLHLLVRRRLQVCRCRRLAGW